MEYQNNQCIRIHPIWVFIKILKLCRNMIGVYFFLLLVNKIMNFSNSILIAILLFIFLISIFSLINFWINFKGTFYKDHLVIHKGKLIKKVKYVPIDNIIGFHEKYNWIEKKLKLSSMIIKINTSEEDEIIKFPYISFNNSKYIKKKININDIGQTLSHKLDDKKKYYKTSPLLLMKSACSSFNIVFFIMFLFSIYSQLNDYINLSSFVNDMERVIFKNNINMSIGILLLFILSYIYGYMKLYLKFGNFTLTHDKDKIVISSGKLAMNEFSILKNSISAISVEANFFQKIIGIEKIKVISINPKIEKFEEDVIIPFSNKNDYKKHLFNLLGVKVDEEVFYNVPKISLIVKLFRATIVCMPVNLITFLIMEQLMYLSIIMTIIIFLSQISQAFFNKYNYTKEEIFIKKNGIIHNKFITSYRDIEEAIISQTFIQKIFNLSSLSFVSKSIPPKINKLHDIPLNHSLNILNSYQEKL